eukprot:125352-Amphidinium_carterae.1
MVQCNLNRRFNMYNTASYKHCKLLMLRGHVGNNPGMSVNGHYWKCEQEKGRPATYHKPCGSACRHPMFVPPTADQQDWLTNQESRKVTTKRQFLLLCMWSLIASSDGMTKWCATQIPHFSFPVGKDCCGQTESPTHDV